MGNNLYEELLNKRKQLEKKYYSKNFDTHSLVEYSVGTSTIRAFRKNKGYVKKYQPLSIYRVWAVNYLDDTKNKNRINSIKDFQKLRNQALENLMKYWKDIDESKPEFYLFNKLIDLLFKCLPLWDSLENNKKKWIYNNTNVPLDKYSLELLNKYIPDLKIKKPISMNSVTNKAVYDYLQLEIKKLCKDLPVILFDLYAWDRPHSFKLIPLKEEE
jgi:hypothetical protein